MVDSGIIVAIVGISTLVGLLGGIYPAFFLSSYRPSQVLGSSSSKNKGSHLVRQILVVFQFAISITLIIATMVIYLQTSLMRNMDKGI
jgi:putative ABC transport system permease protein